MGGCPCSPLEKKRSRRREQPGQSQALWQEQPVKFNEYIVLDGRGHPSATLVSFVSSSDNRGHGTYMGEEKLIASVAGSVERVNKLICVKALKTR